MRGMKKPMAWWVIPGIITGSVAAFGALGTMMVKGAAYITLPDRVEAGEQVNDRQDEALNKLTAIQETWQQIYQRQQAAPTPAPGLREWEESDQTFWCCPAPDASWRQWCFDADQWERCD